MTSFSLYCLLMLDSIINMFQLIGGIVCIICFCILGVIALIYMHADSTHEREEFMEIFNEKRKYFNYLIITTIFSIFLLIVGAFIPTSKQMAVIYVVPKLVNNEQIQKIGPDSLKVLEKLVKEYIEQ